MKKSLPGIGMRMVKSAAAVLLCLLISLWVNREEMRIYASIAALLCIQPYEGDTKRMARQRLTGTAIGSAFGALAILLEVNLLHIRGAAGGYLLIALCILPVLWTAVALGVQNAAYFSCVVFLSITVTHITDADPWIFVWHRVAETVLGIAVGILVNAFHLPRRKRRDILFVSGLDRVLLDMGEMTPYSRVALNRMLDDGAQFTLSTQWTPASILESTAGLRFRLPMVVMDGAALYDPRKNAYLRSVPLPRELALACCGAIEDCGTQCFLNGLMEDVLMIYYGELKNEAERDIYARLHASPYRNYVSRSRYHQCPVLYLMAIDRTERIQAALDCLTERGLAQQVRLRMEPSQRYAGYSYLKIYQQSTSRQAMLEQLKADLGVERSVMFTTRPGEGDVVVAGGDSNRMVRLLERMYEPYLWERR